MCDQDKCKHFDAECSGCVKGASARSEASLSSRLAIEIGPPAETISENGAQPARLDDEVRVLQEPINETVIGEEEIRLDEIEVIEEYMKDLLSRASGKREPNLPVEPQPLRRKTKYDELPTEKLLEVEAAPPSVILRLPALVPTEAKLLPRSKPPESNSWSTMRRLGSTEAHAAIDTYDRNCRLRRALNSGIAGLACLTGTAVALIFVPYVGPTMQTGSMIGVVVGIYFLYVSSVSARDLLAF